MKPVCDVSRGGVANVQLGKVVEKATKSTINA